jgi:hypothetical protein
MNRSYSARRNTTAVFPSRVRSGLVLAFGTAALACGSGEPSDPCAGRSEIHAGSAEVSATGDLEELECVQVITGDLTISDPELRSLEPLGSLVHVMGDLQIADSYFDEMPLVSVKGLERLTEVGGELALVNLPKLESLEPLGALETVGGSVTLSGLSLLESVEGLGSLRTIGGDLRIDRNERLVELAGLASLQSVEGHLGISENPKLNSLRFGESEGPSVGSIRISGNGSLARLDRFPTPRPHDEPCQSAVFGDDVAITDNERLEELVLPEAANWCISISRNTRLTSLSGPSLGRASLELVDLPKLREVDLELWSFDALYIGRTGLETLDGFKDDGVECELDVWENPSLEDVSALFHPSNLVLSRLFLSDNPKLATCELQSIVDGLPTGVGECVRDGRTRATRLVEIDGNDDAAVCE